MDNSPPPLARRLDESEAGNQCLICLETTRAGDVKMGCGCAMHYLCLVQGLHVKLGEGHGWGSLNIRGVRCPNGAQCNSPIDRNYYITLADLDNLVDLGATMSEAEAASFRENDVPLLTHDKIAEVCSMLERRGGLGTSDTARDIRIVGFGDASKLPLSALRTPLTDTPTFCVPFDAYQKAYFGAPPFRGSYRYVATHNVEVDGDTSLGDLLRALAELPAMSAYEPPSRRRPSFEVGRTTVVATIAPAADMEQSFTMELRSQQRITGDEIHLPSTVTDWTLLNSTDAQLDADSTVRDVFATRGLFLRIFVDVPPTPGTMDIGLLQAASSSALASSLLDQPSAASALDVQKLVDSLGAAPQASLLLEPRATSVGPAQRAALRALVDARHAAALPLERGETAGREGDCDGDGGRDFKLHLTDTEAKEILGPSTMGELRVLFAHNGRSRSHDKNERIDAGPSPCVWDGVILRRCCAHGKRIHLHVDHSLRTMQVALNERGDEFSGGRLVYAMSGALVQLERPAGSAVVHDASIAHGVTELQAGTRYGLFFLKNRQ